MELISSKKQNNLQNGSHLRDFMSSVDFCPLSHLWMTASSSLTRKGWGIFAFWVRFLTSILLCLGAIHSLRGHVCFSGNTIWPFCFMFVYFFFYDRLKYLLHDAASLDLEADVFLRYWTKDIWLFNSEIKIHVYVKRQTWICTTWPSFPLNCRLLFITSTQK